MITKKQIYSQVNSIINALGEKYISRLPEDTYRTIMENRDFNYNPEVDLTKSLNHQNITKESLSMIAYLHVRYWATPEEKEKIKSILDSNEENFNDTNLVYTSEELIKSDMELSLIPIIENKNFLDKIVDKILSKYFGL